MKPYIVNYTRTNFSCKTCTKRFAGCHSTCEDYKKEKQSFEKLKNENKKKVVRSFGNNEFNILGNQMRNKK